MVQHRANKWETGIEPEEAPDKRETHEESHIRSVDGFNVFGLASELQGSDQVAEPNIGGEPRVHRQRCKVGGNRGRKRRLFRSFDLRTVHIVVG